MNGSICQNEDSCWDEDTLLVVFAVKYQKNINNHVFIVMVIFIKFIFIRGHFSSVCTALESNDKAADRIGKKAKKKVCKQSFDVRCFICRDVFDKTLEEHNQERSLHHVNVILSMLNTSLSL